MVLELFPAGEITQNVDFHGQEFSGPALSYPQTEIMADEELPDAYLWSLLSSFGKNRFGLVSLLITGHLPATLLSVNTGIQRTVAQHDWSEFLENRRSQTGTEKTIRDVGLVMSGNMVKPENPGIWRGSLYDVQEQEGVVGRVKGSGDRLDIDKRNSFLLTRGNDTPAGNVLAAALAYGGFLKDLPQAITVEFVDAMQGNRTTEYDPMRSALILGLAEMVNRNRIWVSTAGLKDILEKAIGGSVSYDDFHNKKMALISTGLLEPERSGQLQICALLGAVAKPMGKAMLMYKNYCLSNQGRSYLQDVFDQPYNGKQNVRWDYAKTAIEQEFSLPKKIDR